MKEVWVFNGAEGRFPSAVFLELGDAEEWIKNNGLSGVLTKYPVGISVYDWAVENGHFRIKNEKEKSSAFIQKFSSAAQEHFHFENGSSE
ncbi:DUF7710 domain-containing protein [Pseudomonas entomophila]|uniref:DUF7710 domain-containing protein n=1 Tax=Pseudomonas entomophila TaxID=312306 RepID=UPI001F020D46|nr:hypothetical protein [Pseudomonas entomophila]MCG8294644.1 hypothetical protein [Pseudomonas entomophila]